jgi:hypothetical protein
MALGRCIGFRELFLLAKKRPWTADEERSFNAADQATRNRHVRELAAESGCVQTEDRVGTDSVIYTAFWMRGDSAKDRPGCRL